MGAVARVQAPQGKSGDPIRDSALGLVPETVDQIARLNHHAWRSSPIRASLLEIVRLRNARTVNCQFCKSVRYDLARRDGLTENKVDQIADGYEQSALSEEEKLAVAFADTYLHDSKVNDGRTRLAAEETFHAGPARAPGDRAGRLQRHLSMRGHYRRDAGESPGNGDFGAISESVPFRGHPHLSPCP